MIGWKTSRPGETLAGLPMSPPSEYRLRPFGHKAIIVSGHYGPRIEYEQCPAQAAWDKEAMPRG